MTFFLIFSSSSLPTAAGERYCDPLMLSFVRRKEQKIPKVRDPIASTNADLRKLGTADAKLYLLKFGCASLSLTHSHIKDTNSDLTLLFSV